MQKRVESETSKWYCLCFAPWDLAWAGVVLHTVFWGVGLISKKWRVTDEQEKGLGEDWYWAVKSASDTRITSRALAQAILVWTCIWSVWCVCYLGPLLETKRPGEEEKRNQTEVEYKGYATNKFPWELKDKILKRCNMELLCALSQSDSFKWETEVKTEESATFQLSLCGWQEWKEGGVKRYFIWLCKLCASLHIQGESHLFSLTSAFLKLRSECKANVFACVPWVFTFRSSALSNYHHLQLCSSGGFVT